MCLGHWRQFGQKLRLQQSKIINLWQNTQRLSVSQIWMDPLPLKQPVLNALTSEDVVSVSAWVNCRKVMEKQHKDHYPTIHCGDLCPERMTQLMSFRKEQPVDKADLLLLSTKWPLLSKRTPLASSLRTSKCAQRGSCVSTDGFIVTFKLITTFRGTGHASTRLQTDQSHTMRCQVRGQQIDNMLSDDVRARRISAL